MGIFDGCVFCSVGFLRRSSFAWFSDVESHGGACAWTVDGRTTHLVVDSTESLGEPLVRSAVELGSCWIVSEDFLEQSIAKGRRLNERDFMMGPLPAKLVDTSSSGAVGAVRFTDFGSAEPDASGVFPRPPQPRPKIPVSKYAPKEKNAQFDENDYKITLAIVLQVTEIDENANKYYGAEIHEGHALGSTRPAFRVFTHYGRIGDLQTNPESGQRECRYAASAEQARLVFDWIVFEKTGPAKGYRKVDLTHTNIGSDLMRRLTGASTSPSSSSSSSSAPVDNAEPASALHPSVQNLVDCLFTEAEKSLTTSIQAKITTRGIETPLGVLTAAQVEKGQALLDEMFAILSVVPDGQMSAVQRDKLVELSGRFYTVVPHPIGRSKIEVQQSVILDLHQWDIKYELVQLMRDMVAAISESYGAGSALDNKYRALKNTIVPLLPSSLEYQDVRQYVVDSQLSDYATSVDVVNIFALSRDAEWSTFDSSSRAIHPQSLLFHGSRAANYVGLLSRGLLMPRAVTARGVKRTDAGMLGAGLYFGDRASTAAQYCHPAANQSRFMLLCRVALGPSADFDHFDTTLAQPPSGYLSTHGVRRTPDRPSEFKDDEWVVYATSQQRQEFLVEFRLLPQPPPGPDRPVSDLRVPAPCRFTELPRPAASTAALSGFVTTPAPSFAAAAPTPVFTPAPSFTTTAPPSFPTTTTTVPSSVYTPAVVPPPAAPVSAAPVSIEKPPTSTNYTDFPPLDVTPQPVVVVQPPAPFSSSASPALPSNYTDFAVSSSSSSSSSTGFPAEFHSQKDVEDRYRRDFAAGVASDASELLWDVHSATFSSKLSGLTATTSLPLIGASWKRSHAVGSATNFAQQWQAITQGIFDGMDWSNVLAAGGSVLAAATGADAERRGHDVDLFVYGLDEAAATRKLEAICAHVLSKRQGTHTTIEPVVRSRHAVTILGQAPQPHVQIILRLYKSAAEVLIGFDIDSCCFGYDGSRVVCLPRAARALANSANIVDLSRRSPSYEHRLWKYCKRGFAVACPGLDRARVDSGLYTTSSKPQGLGALLKLEWAGAGQPANTDGDYDSGFFIPWGVAWHLARIIRHLARKASASFFARKAKNGGNYPTGHLLVIGLAAMRSGRPFLSEPTAPAPSDPGLLFGPLTWLKDDPGRQGQLFTGSFSPLSPDNWDTDAYASYGGRRGEIPPAPLQKSAGKLPRAVKPVKVKPVKVKPVKVKAVKVKAVKVKTTKVKPVKAFASRHQPVDAWADEKPTKAWTQSKTSKPIKASDPFDTPKTSTKAWADSKSNKGWGDSEGWGESKGWGDSKPIKAADPFDMPKTTTKASQWNKPPPIGLGVRKQGPGGWNAPAPSWSTGTSSSSSWPQQSGARAPETDVGKLLLLVSMLTKGGLITELQRGQIKRHILSKDPNCLVALEVFEVDHDFKDLADTLIRVVSSSSRF